LLSKMNILLARGGVIASVAGLLLIIVVVIWQVVGRYVLNDSPTWTESLALVLILYVTLIGAAVGVRDAGHIGMESLLVLAPAIWQRRIEILIHVLVAVFGAAMAYNGWLLGASVAPYKLANLELSEAARYVPLVLSGGLIVLFSIEHMLALIQDKAVPPTWN